MSAVSDVVSPEALLLRIPCFSGDLNQAADSLVRRAVAGEGGYACLANVHVVVTARRNPALRRALEGAWMVYPDGWPISWLLRRLGRPESQRIAGPDLMPAALDRGRGVGLRHFLFGASQLELRRLKERIEYDFPGAEIVGACAPAFGDVDGSDVAAILESRPHVVWCALGAPKQELWMSRYAPALAPALVVGVGAAFDFLSGMKPRAPRWAQALGLEWLHRLRTEPIRLAPRYLTTNTRFLLDVSRDLLRGARRRAPSPPSMSS